MSIPTTPSSLGRAVPIGPLLLRILAIVYRACRAALLIGPVGVGKSELIAQLCKDLDVQYLPIDLSLLEPSDLVGLPRHENGRTVFSPPAWLPTGGRGILVFEELNRAERFILGPVLQLLSARRLNDYVLPDGWCCMAAVNPDDGVHDVRPLDPAMTSRFVVLPVRADRREWLQWARCNSIHPAILHVVASDPSSLDAASPPRAWKHASDLLSAMTDAERKDRELLHETLSGVLPEPWAIVLIDALGTVRDGDLIAVDVLRRIATDERVRTRLDQLREQGRTDVLRALAEDLREIIASAPDLGRLIAQKDFSLDGFELLLTKLPGDLRDPLQQALGNNPAAQQLVEVDFGDLLLNGYQARGTDQLVAAWQQEPRFAHRLRLFVTGLCTHLRGEANLMSLRRMNSGRRVLGRILADLRSDLRDPLLDCLARLNIEAILPERKDA